MCFVSAKMTALCKEEGLSMCESSKKLGAIWRNLSDSDKEEFQKTRLADLERFKLETEQMSKQGFFMTEDGRKSSD